MKLTDNTDERLALETPIENDTDNTDNTEEALKVASAIPARFTNSVRFYRHMERNSRQMYAKIVWEGSAVAVLRDMGLPASYYQGIVGFLKDSGSIALLKRGGGPTPSLWVLDHEPTYEEYINVTNAVSLQEVKEKESKDSFLRIANDIVNRLTVVETELNVMKRAYLKLIEKED